MRMVLSLLLLVAALGTAGALAVWGAQREAGASDTFSVTAVGPGGEVVLERAVPVEQATVLRALQMAADDASVELELIDYPGMGTYVRSIAGLRAQGATGWIYEVHRAGAWINGDRSAEHFALQKGDATRWTWTAG